MRIDAKLNIVIEVETADGSVFVHSTPLSRDVFERYFLVIGQTFAELVGKGLSLLSGPRVAALLLKDVAQRGRVWDGPGGVANGLMAEVRRLSNVIMPGPAGWRTVPLQDAIDKQLLSEDYQRSTEIIEDLEGGHGYVPEDSEKKELLKHHGNILKVLDKMGIESYR